MDGILVIDKPEGWTSHDVVGKMRRLAGTKKVGHLGTLDPIATGVLPVMIGNATRLAQFYSRAGKAYEAVVRFGFATDTYDRAGKPVSELAETVPSPEAVAEALALFRGDIQQIPPRFSAKKKAGVPAYKRARNEEEFELEPVAVTIHELEVISQQGPDFVLRVRCSAGTYVRSLAHDLGRVLGVGAHLQDLRRTASGDFRIGQAHTLAQLAELPNLASALLPAAELVPEFPGVSLDELTISQIRQGRDFRTSPFGPARDALHVKALSYDGELIAIGEAVLPNLYHPVVVFGAT